jgi:UDP:flavonoid glycosyltransferase YjiC (YdhE family)
MLGALLAWESGSGRGHVVTLKTVAEALSNRFTFDAALCDLTFKDELAGLCDPVQGPWLPYSDEYRKARGNPLISTWGEFLGDTSLRDPDILRQSIGWWQTVMLECDISLVIADCAPCAMLAARGLRIPTVAVGTGYLLPPPHLDSFPVLQPRYTVRIHEEAEILDAVNSVLPEFGVPALDRLPGIYTCSDQLAFTVEMLDPYTAWRSEPLLPPIMGGAFAPASGGEEIFVYFSTSEKSEHGLIEALGTLGVPVRAFIPGLEESVAEDLTRRGVHVERAPVPIDLVSNRSRLLVNAAQHGTVCFGLAAGLPQVSVPQHREQRYNAETLQDHGALKRVRHADRGAERFRSIVLDAYEDAAMAKRARDLAQELRPAFEANQRKMIRRRIADAMERRV